jgi:Skp family chaperone for outer membrane proteins
MPFPRLIPLLSLALLALAAPPATAQPAPGPVQPGTTRVAVANPSRIFNEMQETKALRKGLEAKGKVLAEKEKQMRADIGALLEKREQFRPGSEQRREINGQIDQAKAGLQNWGVATKAALDRDQKEMLMSLYDKIEVAVNEIAQKNGIDLVIVDGRQELQNADDAPAAEVSRMLNARNILFAAKKVDITEQVITLLDAKFAQSGAVPPPIR